MNNLNAILGRLVVAITILLPCFGWADCNNASFAELSEVLLKNDDLDGVEILNVERLVSDHDDCNTVWFVEFLPDEGDVEYLIFDGDSLQILDIQIEEIEERFGFLDEENDRPEVEIEKIILRGTAASEFFEGHWSDDISIGGPGRDVFMVTPGTDLIMDFNPSQDVIDFSDFAIGDPFFGELGDLDDLRQNSVETIVDGIPSVRVQIEAEDETWSVELKGVTASDLNRFNVSFDLERLFEQDFEPTDSPAKTVYADDGTIIEIAAHGIDEPPSVHLVEGPSESVPEILDVLAIEDVDQCESC